MPLSLQFVPLEDRFDGYDSVLFVACGVCPHLQTLWEEQEDLVSWRSVFSRGDAFTEHMKELVTQARSTGLRSDWFRTPKLVATCLWPERVSEALVRRAAGYDAVGVIGCESAVATVRRALPDLPVVQLVRVTGIANYRLQVKLPWSVRILESTHVALRGVHGDGS